MTVAGLSLGQMSQYLDLDKRPAYLELSKRDPNRKSLESTQIQGLKLPKSVDR